MVTDREKGYFNPDYRDSRRRVTGEYRELAEQQLPTPEKSWGVIWPLAGPELTFEEQALIAPEEKHKTAPFNQTKGRFETALNIAKQVTALRINKDPKNVTMDDIKQAGPVLYWNGRPPHNEYLTEIAACGELEKQYNFPVSKIVITTNRDIKNTGDQFNDFPINILPPGEKVVIVSDLYHLPRVRRYASKEANKFPPERIILYPSQPSRLPLRPTLQEIRKIHKYSEEGILPPEK